MIMEEFLEIHFIYLFNTYVLKSFYVPVTGLVWGGVGQK